MSRLVGLNLLNKVLRPPSYRSRLQRSLLILKQQKQQLERQNVIIRYLASYGVDRPPVDHKEVELRVFKSLSSHDKVDPKSVKFESHLANDLGLDSLDHVEIMVALEDEFDVSIDDVDAEKIHTVKDIIDFVIKALENKPDPRKNPGPRYDPNMDFGPN